MIYTISLFFLVQSHQDPSEKHPDNVANVGGANNQPRPPGINTSNLS